MVIRWRKFRLTQNIYIILNPIESKEVNKKPAFLPQSVKKAVKAESIEEMACNYQPTGGENTMSEHTNSTVNLLNSQGLGMFLNI